MRSCGFKSHLPHLFHRLFVLHVLIYHMRKCRNWQTSKTKDLVSIALVWVQVPSSALTEILKALENCPRGLFLLEKYESRKNECDRKSKVMNEICGMFEKDAAVCLRYGMVNFWSVFVFSILWVVNHIFP